MVADYKYTGRDNAIKLSRLLLFSVIVTRLDKWSHGPACFQEGSDDSLSQSSSHVEGHNSTLVSTPAPAPSTTTTASKSPKGRRKLRKSRREWEILEGLRDGQKCEDKPDKYQGYLMKRRKWPMKGWHKVRLVHR